MKRRACPWCVKAVCPCGWKGYRSRGSLADPRWCPRCLNLPLGGRPRTLDVRHRMSTVCHFIPAAELIKLKE
jgi:hypothetical protein